MHTENIEYQADGARRVGYLAVDRSKPGPRPGVLIAPEASGVHEIAKERARTVAELGYVAFVMDYVGDGVVLDSLEKSVANLAKYRDDPMKIRAIGRASLDVMRAQPELDPSKLAAIGYCFGGAAVFELARDGADLACSVGFHAQLSTKRPDDAHQIKGKILACIGSDDPMVPPEQRLAFEDEMKRGKVDWRLYVFGNQVHGFMNPAVAHLNHPALRYHAPTHQRAWRAMLDLFDETFGQA